MAGTPPRQRKSRAIAPTDQDRLTGAQWQAVFVLATGGTQEAAAKAANVAESTIKRWKQLPGFGPAVRATSRELAESTLDRLQFAARAAVNTLLAILANPNARDETKIRAAHEILAKVGTLDMTDGRVVGATASPGVERQLLVVTEDLVARLERQRYELETARLERLAALSSDRAILGELEPGDAVLTGTVLPDIEATG